MTESLRNISESYLAIKDELLNSIDLETGEVLSDNSIDLTRDLENIQERFEVKAQNVALVCLELKDKKDMIDREIARLKKLSDRAKTAQEWLENYLTDTMTSVGYERIDGTFSRISFRSSEETIIDNIALLPSEYVTVETTYKPDKKAIKAAIKAGKEVNGAHLEKKKNLQIK